MGKCNCQLWVDPNGDTWHDGQCAFVTLSWEARQRIQDKVESVKRAQMYAKAHAHETVIG